MKKSKREESDSNRPIHRQYIFEHFRAIDPKFSKFFFPDPKYS